MAHQQHSLVVRMILANKGRRTGSWYSSQARVQCGVQRLDALGSWGGIEQGTSINDVAHRLWSTWHGHHSESVTPIILLVARNETVFAQPDLRHFRRTQIAGEVVAGGLVRWTLYKFPQGVAADSPLVGPSVLNPWWWEWIRVGKGSCSSWEGFPVKSLS